MEQVKNTLIANAADPDKKTKTINDLKFKQGWIITLPLTYYRLAAEEE